MKEASIGVAESAYVVENVIAKVLPGALRDKPEADKDYRWFRVRASSAKIALERGEELAEKLGDNAPDMNAPNLHSWVWDSCKLLWNDGHCHQAVMAAAIQVNAETQKKLGRLDISEKSCLTRLFLLMILSLEEHSFVCEKMTAARPMQVYIVVRVLLLKACMRVLETLVCMNLPRKDE